MEISPTELRRLAADVDDQHRSGMATVVAELAEHVVPLGAATTRRRFLSRAGVGGALTIGSLTLPWSQLLGSAAAQAGGPTDIELASFAQSLELTAAEAYEAGRERLSEEVRPVAEAFARHHRDHAGAFSALIGPEATNRPNPGLQAQLGAQLRAATTEQAVLEVAFGLEQAAASTYLLAIGALQSQQAASVAASILPVEAQHAVVIGQALGKRIEEYLPVFESVQAAADPATYAP